MDYFKKVPPEKIVDLDKKIGRMMRNMSILNMSRLGPEKRFLAADVYESEDEVLVYVDVSGIDPREISVIAKQDSITVSGNRILPMQDKIRNIHQLEIERGFFKRTISFPVPVDVTHTSSFCKDGFLFVRLPKQQKKGRIAIKVS